MGDHTKIEWADSTWNAIRAIGDVIAERRRQIDVEGWTAEHDDQHTTGGMALAAACYAAGRSDWWPRSWSLTWWKPKTRRRNLIRAAALIVAEIERLDRAAATEAGNG